MRPCCSSNSRASNSSTGGALAPGQMHKTSMLLHRCMYAATDAEVERVVSRDVAHQNAPKTFVHALRFLHLRLLAPCTVVEARRHCRSSMIGRCLDRGRSACANRIARRRQGSKKLALNRDVRCKSEVLELRARVHHRRKVCADAAGQ
jgi:hypothetical protein